MHVRKRIFTFLFAALVMALLTACGRWDYSREAVKAANEAQGDTLRVEFKVNQTFTNALRAAADDNIQPADVDNAMTMDKSIEKLLTSGYRLDVYALRADIDAEQAAEQLADEFVNRLAGCEDEGFISMVKAENGYFYEAVLTYKHGGSGSGSGSGSGDDGGGEEPEEPETTEYLVQWYENASGGYEAGTLILRADASTVMNNSTQLTLDAVKSALKAGQYADNEASAAAFSFKNVQHLIVEDGSGVTEIPGVEDDADIAAAGISPELFFSSNELQTLDLSGVKDIGSAAFYNIHTLRSVDLKNNGDIKIGVSAFRGTIFLVTVKIASGGNLEIGKDAFLFAFDLQMINEESKLTLQGKDITIGEGAFHGIGNENHPVTVTFDGTVRQVGDRAFSENKGSGQANNDVNKNVTIYYNGGADRFKKDAKLNDLSTVGLSEDNFR